MTATLVVHVCPRCGHRQGAHPNATVFHECPRTPLRRDGHHDTTRYQPQEDTAE